MQLIKWWVTILEDKTPGQAVALCLIGAVVVALLWVIGRGVVALCEPTPDESVQPKRPPPAAAGLKRAQRRIG